MKRWWKMLASKIFQLKHGSTLGTHGIWNHLISLSIHLLEHNASFVSVHCAWSKTTVGALTFPALLAWNHLGYGSKSNTTTTGLLALHPSLWMHLISLEMPFACLHVHKPMGGWFFASHLFVASTVRYRPVASVTKSSCGTQREAWMYFDP